MRKFLERLQVLCSFPKIGDIYKMNYSMESLEGGSENGPLPKRRAIRTKPFENVGVDYFGPLIAKENDDKTKVHGIIITCMTTRMVHMEVVTDTSTDKLLLALRRFFARRGVRKSITSDNGPSFVLAD
uniref:Integrase catalytic domain-containing protein n=1 Tax=Haemonchus contortus TaxID=6289 RepID=A0A7I4YKJ4_HAECO